MGGLSWWHWLIIIAAFILLFGAKRLPDAARSVGFGLRATVIQGDDPIGAGGNRNEVQIGRAQV